MVLALLAISVGETADMAGLAALHGRQPDEE